MCPRKRPLVGLETSSWLTLPLFSDAADTEKSSAFEVPHMNEEGAASPFWFLPHREVRRASNKYDPFFLFLIKQFSLSRFKKKLARN